MSPFKVGNWCLACGKYDHEAAGTDCRNPGWHYGEPVAEPVGTKPDREEDAA